MPEPSTELSLTVHSGARTEQPAAPLTSAHDDRGATQTQVGKLVQEMNEAWRRGHRLFAESFLDRYPEVRENRDAVLRLVCEEIALRQQAGLELSREDILRRFPKWRVELQALLDCHELIGAEDPTVGDHKGVQPLLEEFEVLAELGEGAQGQVYLGRQRSLANRPLVVKVSTRKGDEHLSMARLQHTNIVPLYWMKDDVEADRRTLVMPYFGKVTVSSVLRTLHLKPMSERTGKDIVEVLDRARETMALDQPGQSPIRAYFAKIPYVESVCWIGACLAEALEYAHQRGLVHLDMKPSNILLANDGMPMLLDFHLSRPPIIPGQARPTRMGGTPMYMSPEQHAGMAALSAGRDIPLPIDGRSDIYSLGVILYQMLGGKVPLLAQPPRLDTISSVVTCGLADIVEKCLASKAEDRYQSGAALAEDLTRHIRHEPLRGVPNRSWKERWRKYRRRKPHGLTILFLVLALVVGSIVAGVWLINERASRRTERRERITALVSDSQKYLESNQFVEAARLLEAAVNLASEGSEAELHQAAIDLLQKTQRREVLARLSELVEGLRFATTGTASREQQALEKACRALWASRDKILAVSAEDAGQEAVDQAKLDLLDAAVLSAHVRVSLAAPPVKAEVSRDVLTSLQDAEKLFGFSPVLAREVERFATMGGVTVEPKETRGPNSAWEYYALGRSFLLEGNVAKAAAHFEESLKLDPQAFWSNFSAGLCAYRMNQYADAVSSFRAALVARRCAPVHYNRGLAYFQLKDFDRAVADFTQAIQLDSRFAPAWLARGRLHLEKENFSYALSDFHQALDCAQDPSEAHFHSALAYRGLKNRAEALSSVEQALRYRPDFAEAKKLRAQLTGGR